MDPKRRREDLGTAASAALPLIWAAQEREGWSDADLADKLDESRAKIAKLLYGERRAGRQLAAKFLMRVGIPLEAWDEPCPVARRQHVTPSHPPGKAA